MLRVVGKFIELRPVHVAPRPGYILLPSRGAKEGGTVRENDRMGREIERKGEEMGSGEKEGRAWP